jgi:hypothetical protein
MLLGSTIVADDPEKPLPQRTNNAVVDGSIGGRAGRGETVGEILRRTINELKAGPTNDEEPSEQRVSSPEGSLPTTWREAVPYVVWVVLILGFGLETVAALVHFEWVRAIVSAIGLVAMMAAILHWKQIRSWASELNPNWIVAALSLLLAGLILSPFVEQRRWPFSTVFRDPPSAEDIANATAPLRAEVARLQQQLQAGRAPPSPPLITGLTTSQEMLQRIENLEKQLAQIMREA